ncbi:serine hydrolase domain-containing protein [Nocardia ninae]|uniref:Serine hydrolase n=1 Tax=Nocardia ninae NBRC 108245 TaxID=1210091 RepID=A0A511MGM1_9NOCA|nr:serine hydrolase domain-containing protein [Nocardia ninae]GEM39794.1 serine hydrolase [Nocardia ninae NBRC 108245]
MLDELSEAIEEVLPDIVAATGAPGVAVALATATDLRSFGAGYADLAQRIPMTGESIGPAGSLSKPLLGVALMQLVEAGAMALDAPINSFLPAGLRPPDPAAAPITPVLLTSHQGGYRTDFIDATLERPGPFDEHFARRVAIGRTPEYGGVSPLLGTPGTYAYSSLGMSLIGSAVEHLTGERYADFVDRRIGRPLGMSSSAVPAGASALSRWDELRQAADRAVGYMGFGDWCVPSPEFHAATYPAAGLLTSPADYARLLRSMLRSADGADDGIVTPASLSQMLVPRIGRSSPVTPDTWAGIGLEISNADRLGDRFWWGHSAAYPWGYWWDARVYPRSGLVVVAMVNKWDMMRLHNPATRNAAGIVAEWAGRWAAEGVPTSAGRALARTGLSTGGAPTPTPASSAWIGAVAAERAYGTLGVAERWDGAATKSMVLGARPSDGSNPPGLDLAAFEAAVDAIAALAPDPDAIRSYAGNQGPEAALWALACGASTAEFPMPVAALAGPHP